jgi:hypothetical protein
VLGNPSNKGNNKKVTVGDEYALFCARKQAVAGTQLNIVEAKFKLPSARASFSILIFKF